MTEIITSIKDDDIYKHLQAYPASHHRSTALGAQAAMLYVLLYFVPDYLKRERGKCFFK